MNLKPIILRSPNIPNTDHKIRAIEQECDLLRISQLGEC